MKGRFNFGSYLRLRWLSFVRSPLLQAKIVAKIFYGFLFLMIAGEFILLGIFPYYFITEEFPGKDPLEVLSRYVYIYVVIAFSMLLMAGGFASANLKPFLLLPVKRRKILRYYLVGSWFNTVLILASVWIWTVVITYALNGYDVAKLLAWASALQLTVMIFSVVSWFTERSGVVYFISMALFIFVMLAIKRFPHLMAPLGKPYQAVAEGRYWVLLIFMLAFGLIYTAAEQYLYKRFYAQINKREKEKVMATGLSWANRLGTAGAFIQNDIRLILRNKRPRMLISQAVFMIFYAVFIFGSGWYENYFSMYVFAAVFLTGVFLLNYGSFIPAWESEHFKLLVSQSIDFKKYLEAKWLLMNFSVLILTVLSLPFIYFGRDILYLILAFALFNAGIGSYLVLWTGIFNKTPLKINAGMQAFRSSHNSNWKIFLWGLLRIGIPMLIFFLFKWILGLYAALALIAAMGLTGFLLKDYFLNALAKLYNSHKYAFVHSFSKSEES